jgi:hypothetical protein
MSHSTVCPSRRSILPVLDAQRGPQQARRRQPLDRPARPPATCVHQKSTFNKQNQKKKEPKNNVRDESVYDWRHTTTVPRFVQDDHLSLDEYAYDWRHTTTVPRFVQDDHLSHDEYVYDWRHTTTVPRFVQDDHLSLDEYVYDWRHTTILTVTIRPWRSVVCCSYID